jgi:hypothetical protein
MQGSRSTGSALVNQQQVTIRAQRRELLRVHCGRADCILAGTTHQRHDWIGQRRTVGGGDDSDMDWELPAVWPTGILRHMEDTASGNLRHAGQCARRKFNGQWLERRCCRTVYRAGMPEPDRLAQQEPRDEHAR